MTDRTRIYGTCMFCSSHLLISLLARANTGAARSHRLLYLPYRAWTFLDQGMQKAALRDHDLGQGETAPPITLQHSGRCVHLKYGAARIILAYLLRKIADCDAVT